MAQGLALFDRAGKLLYRNPRFARSLGVYSIVVCLRAPVSRPRTPAQKRAEMTRRELEVALLVAFGASNAEVAAELGITEHTARRHTEGVMRKLQVSSRAKVAVAMLGARKRSA